MTRDELAEVHDLPDFEAAFASILQAGFAVAQANTSPPLYEATVTEEECTRSQFKRIADQVFGGSFERLVQAMYRGKKMNPDEIAEAKKYIEGIE